MKENSYKTYLDNRFDVLHHEILNDISMMAENDTEAKDDYEFLQKHYSIYQIAPKEKSDTGKWSMSDEDYKKYIDEINSENQPFYSKENISDRDKKKVNRILAKYTKGDSYNPVIEEEIYFDKKIYVKNFLNSFSLDTTEKNIIGQRKKHFDYISANCIFPRKKGNSTAFFISNKLIEALGWEDDFPKFRIGLEKRKNDRIIFIPVTSNNEFSINQCLNSELLSRDMDTPSIYCEDFYFLKDIGIMEYANSTAVAITIPDKSIINIFEKEKEVYTGFDVPPFILYYDYFGQFIFERLAPVPKKYHLKSEYGFIPNHILSNLIKDYETGNIDKLLFESNLESNGLSSEILEGLYKYEQENDYTL